MVCSIRPPAAQTSDLLRRRIKFADVFDLLHYAHYANCVSIALVDDRRGTDLNAHFSAFAVKQSGDPSRSALQSHIEAELDIALRDVSQQGELLLNHLAFELGRGPPEQLFSSR